MGDLAVLKPAFFAVDVRRHPPPPYAQKLITSLYRGAICREEIKKATAKDDRIVECPTIRATYFPNFFRLGNEVMRFLIGDWWGWASLEKVRQIKFLRLSLMQL